MRPDLPDELLSGYLDGELAPSERAVVEQQLAGSPADCEFLCDLQSLHSDLASLPAADVSPDFTTRVVQAVADLKSRPAKP